jgi:uncharacterized protein (UPF0335 family)
MARKPKQVIEAADMNEPAAQELLTSMAKDIIAVEDKVIALKEEIAEIMKTAKNEGFNPKAVKVAIKRYREYLKGLKDSEVTLTESDIYFDVLKTSLA